MNVANTGHARMQAGCDRCARCGCDRQKGLGPVGPARWNLAVEPGPAPPSHWSFRSSQSAGLSAKSRRSAPRLSGPPDLVGHRGPPPPPPRPPPPPPPPRRCAGSMQVSATARGRRPAGGAEGRRPVYRVCELPAREARRGEEKRRSDPACSSRPPGRPVPDRPAPSPAQAR